MERGLWPVGFRRKIELVSIFKAMLQFCTFGIVLRDESDTTPSYWTA
jgi:hypothetical protein